MKLFVLGSFICAVILGAYTLTKNFFDYASLVQIAFGSKSTAAAFIEVALYISFCNSFLRNFSFVRCIYQIIQIQPRKNSIYIQFRHVCSFIILQ